MNVYTMYTGRMQVYIQCTYIYEMNERMQVLIFHTAESESEYEIGGIIKLNISWISSLWTTSGYHARFTVSINK